MRQRILVFLSLALVVALVAACAGMPVQPQGDAAPPTELHVLNWQGYGSDEPWAIEQFEEMYGVTVVHDYFNSLDEMLTKLRTSPGVYDVVLPNIAYVPGAVEEGLFQPIDTGQVEVWDNLPSAFQNLPETVIDGEVYGVPWTWGATSLVYNTEVYPEGIDTLNALWDPAYAGEVGFEDNYEDAIIFAALAMGAETPNQPQDLDAVQAKLADLMPNVRALWQSEDEFNRLFSNGEITLGVYWSGSTSRAQTVFELPIAFVIPPEGAIGWTDAWSIPTDAPNAEMAYKWIDFMSSPDFYLEWENVAGAPVPANPAVLDAMPDDSFTKTVFGDPDVTERLSFITATPPDVRERWNEIWEEVKANAN